MRFSDFFRKWRRPIAAHDLAGEVGRNERIARFIGHRSLLYSDSERAKPAAYMPRSGMTSVFRVDGLRTEDVRHLGSRVLKKPPPIAHATCRGSAIYDCDLRFDPDNMPERHANIVGWPERKDHQKLLCIRLAACAEVCRYGPQAS